ncbi:MAG: phosphopyruvate hydratase [Burkholderiaceae bacterium]
MTQASLQNLHARRVWDSRGNPTVEVEVSVAGVNSEPVTGRAIAPAGASRGSREATDLRDGGSTLKGLDVSAALSAIETIIKPALLGASVTDQRGIDQRLIELDGTPLKSRLGGNAMVATSLAVLHAAAAASRQPLWQYLTQAYGTEAVIPLPEIQIFGGGAHAGKRVDIQDFMVMVPGAESFDHALSITAEIYHAAGKLMEQQGRLAGVADEGGWWPVFDSNEQALETLVRAIENAGETPGDRVVISLDVAASEFGKDGQYQLGLDKRSLDSDGLTELLGRWLDKYPIASIEDPLAEDDSAGMVAFTAAYGDRVQIIGDDYLVTNQQLVKQAVSDAACNAVLIKVNQAGTVSESIDTLLEAQAAGWQTIVSARSGETEDVSISHLSTGLGARQLKVGSFTRSERMAKWNECLRISDELQRSTGKPAPFAGATPLAGTEWGRRAAG